MVSRRALLAVAILVTIGVLGVGAATLPTLDATGSGDGNGENGEPGGENGDPVENLVITIPSWIVAVIFALGMVLVAVAAVVLLRDGDTRFLRIMAIAVAVGILLLLLIELVDIPFSLEEQPLNETGDESGENGDGGDGDGENGDGGDVPTTSFSALLALLIAGVVGVALFYWQTASEPDESETVPDETRNEAVKQAADRAADRIEQDSLENGVYQAWSEMTAALSVEQPDTRTPDEFKRAAIAAGFAREDVERLTALFQAVRYGNLPVTEEREQEAMATLRRIADTREHEGQDDERDRTSGKEW